MPSARNDRSRLAYRYLCEAEDAGRAFSADDIAAATGWSVGSCRTYMSKRWHFLLRQVSKGQYRADGVKRLSEDAFLRLQAQRVDPDSISLRPRFTPEADALLDKSREAALLGVQIYNNPLISFRTPGYIVQMIIAHTALFHAVFERNGVPYWYNKPDGSPEIIDGDKKAWDITKCLQEYYPKSTLPEVENLRAMIAIRNKIEHRFIPQLDALFSGKCQALLMNYEQILVKEFGDFFALGTNLALALQFSAYSTDQQAVLRKAQSREYEAVRCFAEQYDAALDPDIVKDLRYSFRAFLIPKIGNHAKSSDVAIQYIKYDPDKPEKMAEYEKQIALIRDKQVPVANLGMYKPSQVATEVSRRAGIKFSINDHTSAWKFYKVRPREKKAQGCDTQYCQFDKPFETFIYTEKWVEFLCKKVAEPSELERIRNFRD
jgi:hypothetical protein